MTETFIPPLWWLMPPRPFVPRPPAAVLIEHARLYR